MIQMLLRAVRRFRESETGTFTAEAVVIFPLLVWSYTAMFVFWDAFKTQNVNLKATYTIADMISREQRTIDQSYLDGARAIYAFLSTGNENHRIRVSVVRNRVDEFGEAALSLEWSQVSGEGVANYTDIDQVSSIIPMLAANDSVIVVTTFTDWRPVFNAGLSPMTLTETSVTAPRFMPQILWQGGAGT
jgi:Flp pilus assembly protein TadG